MQPVPVTQPNEMKKLDLATLQAQAAIWTPGLTLNLDVPTPKTEAKTKDQEEIPDLPRFV